MVVNPNLQNRFNQIQNSRNVQELRALQSDFENEAQRLRQQAIQLENSKRDRLEEQRLREIRADMKRAEDFADDIKKRTRNIRGVTIGATRGEIRQQEKLKNLEKAREVLAKQQRIDQITSNIEQRKAQIKLQQKAQELLSKARKGQSVKVKEIKALNLSPQQERKFTKDIVISTTRKERQNAFLESIKDADFTKYNEAIDKRIEGNKAVDVQSVQESYKVQVNQYLRASGEKPVPFSAPLSNFENRVKKRETLFKDIDKKVGNLSLSESEKLKNKLVTGQTITPKEREVLKVIDIADGKKLTKQQLNSFKKIAITPTLYGQNLVIRARKGQNPLFDDFKKGITFAGNVAVELKNIGKETFTFGVDATALGLTGVQKATETFLAREQKFIRVATEGGSVKQLLGEDLKKIAKPLIATYEKTGDALATFKKNPKETLLLISAAAVAGAITGITIAGTQSGNAGRLLYKLIKKNPERAVAEAIFWLTPTSAISKGSKLTVKSAKKSFEVSSKALKSAKESIKNAKTPEKLNKAILDAKIALTKYNLQKKKLIKPQVLNPKEAKIIEERFKKFEKSENIKPTSKKTITDKETTKLLGFDTVIKSKITSKPPSSTPVKDFSVTKAQAKVDAVTNNKKELKKLLKELKAFGFVATKQKLSSPIIDLINGQVLKVRFLITKKKVAKPKVSKSRKLKKQLKKEKTRKLTEKDFKTKKNGKRVEIGLPKDKIGEINKFEATKKRFNQIKWDIIFKNAEKRVDISQFIKDKKISFTIISPQLPKTKKSFDRFGKKAQTNIFTATENVEKKTKSFSKGIKLKKKRRNNKIVSLRGRKAKKKLSKKTSKKERQRNNKKELNKLLIIKKELEKQKTEIKKEIKTIEELEKKIKSASKIDIDIARGLLGSLKVLSSLKIELKQELESLNKVDLKKINSSIQNLSKANIKAQNQAKAKDMQRPQKLINKSKSIARKPKRPIRKPVKSVKIKKTPPKTPPKKPKRIPTIRLNIKNLPTKGSRKGYLVRIKEGNKIIAQTNVLLPLKRATNFGRKRVDNSLRASFDVVPKGKTSIIDVQNTQLTNKFRVRKSKGTKVLTNVEKKKFRLDKSGEKKEAKNKRIKSKSIKKPKKKPKKSRKKK